MNNFDDAPNSKSRAITRIPLSCASSIGTDDKSSADADASAPLKQNREILSRKMTVAMFVFALGMSMSAGADATNAYRCSSAGQAIAFQDHPCGRGQAQQIMHLSDAIAEPPPAAAVVASAPTEAAKPLQATAPAPRTPTPDFYLCTREDGSRYESANGIGARQAVPLGILGIPVPGFAGASAGSAGITVSTPGPRQSSVLSPARMPLAGSYVWTQDPCHHAEPEEACAYLRDELDATEGKLLHAFSDTEAQLKQARNQLRERLRGC